MEQSILKIFGDGGIVLKNKRTTLRKELVLLCLVAFAISFSVYKIGSNLAVYTISKYYNTETHIQYLEKKYIQELQEYIQGNNISLDDLSLVDDWIFGKDDVYIKLFYKGNLIYDTLYGAIDYSEVPTEKIQNYSKIDVYTLKVGNQEIKVVLFCYDFKIENYCKNGVLIFSFILFLIIILYGVKRKINYLTIISSETEKLTENLNTKITLKGNDEIYEVAQGIDKLRKSIISKIEQEKEAYNSNIALVTALSHDIKTPLTSVISYIELVSEKIKDDEQSLEFLNIALSKALYLRRLTKELFEHFLLKSQAYNITFEKVNANELVVQMVEENLLDLEAKGVSVVRNIKDITSTLSLNIELVYSVFENIFSNLYKYADLKQCIKVQYQIKKEYLEISIENTKNCKKNTNELSTQIGLRNSKAIMERHSGNLEIIDAKDTFKVILRFPVI